MRLLPCIASTALASTLMVIGMSQTNAASPFARAYRLGRLSAKQSVSFVVQLPPRNHAELETLVALQATPGTAIYHHWLSPAQFAQRYAPTPTQVNDATSLLRKSGISIDRVSALFILAHAPAATVNRVFGSEMIAYRASSGHINSGSRIPYTLPAGLHALNARVAGLSYHGEGQPMLRISQSMPLPQPLNRYGPYGPLWFDDYKQAYRMPAYQVANGTGVTVATINEADFNSADVTTYLQHELIGGVSGDLAPKPKVTHMLVPGAPPYDPNNNDSQEANLDVQMVAGAAPGASVVGWTTNAFDFPTDFLEVIDYINETESADIVSISYGLCELLYTAQYNNGTDDTGVLQALHDTFLQGNSEGITFFVSSGDSAGRACPELAYLTSTQTGQVYKSVQSVQIPADDPNVVAVGGGNLITSSSQNSLNATYVSENAQADPEPPTDIYGYGNLVSNLWWGAGGGQSVVFKKPVWQQGITPGSMRSVPDIGAFVGGCFPDDPLFVQPCATTVSHGTFVVQGVFYQVIGTSVAAPESAGYLALIEDYLGSRKSPGAGRLGNVNSFFYALPTSFYHENIPGYNGVVSFSGTNRWNPSYGLGSLFNNPLITPIAGIPQSASNP